MFGVKSVHIFFLVSLQVFGRITACKNVTAVRNIDEKSCEGMWYLYASNKRCDNCCFLLGVDLISPGVYEITEYANQTKSHFAQQPKSVRRKNEYNVYKIANTDKSIMALEIDCTKYTVAFDEAKGALNIWTRQPKPEDALLESLAVLSKCKMKIFKHNPEVACKNYS